MAFPIKQITVVCGWEKLHGFILETDPISAPAESGSVFTRSVTERCTALSAMNLFVAVAVWQHRDPSRFCCIGHAVVAQIT